MKYTYQNYFRSKNTIKLNIMKNLILFPFLLICSFLSAQYDTIDTTFNASYQGINKGLLGTSGLNIYNYRDSLFLVVGDFTKYNNVESHNFVLIDVKGNIIRNYPPNTQLVADSSHINGFRKNRLAFTGQYIYRVFGTDLIKYNIDGSRVDTIYSFNSAYNSGLHSVEDYIYFFARYTVVKIKNDVVLDEHFIEIPIAGPNRSIQDLHFSTIDSSFIVTIFKDNPRDSIYLYKYNFDGSLNNQFEVKGYASVSAINTFTHNNRIYSSQDVIGNDSYSVGNNIICYDLKGKIDPTFYLERVDFFIINIEEDIHGNVFLIGFDFNADTTIRKYSKYGVRDEKFYPKLHGGLTYINDFVPLQNGKAMFTGNFSNFENRYVGHIAVLNGEPKYDCNNLSMNISGFSNIACNQSGYVKLSVEGGIAPFTYYLNDSLINSIDSLTFTTSDYYKVKVIDSGGCYREIVFLMGGTYLGDKFDLSTVMVSETLVRGFNSDIYIDAKNETCLPKDAKLVFTLPSELTNVSAFPAPLVVSGNTYTWFFNQLDGNERIHLEVTTSTAAQLGETKVLKVEISPKAGDIDPDNNKMEIYMPVLGSYDPNDIQSNPGKCDAYFITKNQKINYIVRFQNIGNYPAQNIFVNDSLSAFIDVNTVKVLTSSHDMYVEKLTDHVLKFKFDNINLPGASIDEAASNGFFVFEAAFLPETPLNTIIENEAQIYFDFNEAVSTNKVFNTVTDNIPEFEYQETIKLCSGETFSVDDQTITSDTVFQLLHFAGNGCDSVVSYTVSFDPAIDNSIHINGSTLIAVKDYDLYEWYNCDTNKKVENSENSFMFTPHKSGNYNAIIHNGNCITETNCFYIEVLENHAYLPFVAPNKHWFYLKFNSGDVPRPISAFVLQTGTDTIINNYTYTQLLYSNLKGQHPCPGGNGCFVPNFPYEPEATATIAYLREDLASRKVYLLPANSNDYFCEASEHVIYDFNLEIGEIMPACLYNIIIPEFWNSNDTLGVITFKENKEVFQKERILLHFDGIYQFGLMFIIDMNLIEGVGLDEYNGFFPNSNSILMEFCEGSMEQCHILSSNEDVSTNAVRIAPNPFENSFFIETSENISNITIYNVFGQLVETKITGNEVDLSDQIDGIYFVEFSIGNHKMVKKIIKGK